VSLKLANPRPRPGRRGYPADLKAAVLARYRAGTDKLEALAAEFNVAAYTISEWARAAGIPRRQVQRHATRGPSRDIGARRTYVLAGHPIAPGDIIAVPPDLTWFVLTARDCRDGFTRSLVLVGGNTIPPGQRVAATVAWYRAGMAELTRPY
jgi:hypothetical protein